jgi:hypothetical protein
MKPIFESKGNIEGNIYTDNDNRKWTIVERDIHNNTEVFIAVYKDNWGRERPALFVIGKNGIWGSSIDGSFSTPKMKKIYRERM